MDTLCFLGREDLAGAEDDEAGCCWAAVPSISSMIEAGGSSSAMRRETDKLALEGKRARAEAESGSSSSATGRMAELFSS